MNKLLTLDSLYCNFKEPILNFYSSVHTIFQNQGIFPVDRTLTIIPPINFEIPKEYILKGKDFTNSITYKECCYAKVNQLITLQDKIQKKILINWSGGIDSTAIICSFIFTLGLKEAAERIQISLSPQSAYEYPLFFKKFILPNFEIKNSLLFLKNNPEDYITVDGEPNGAICGPELLLLWSNLLGPDFLKQKISFENIKNALHCRASDIPTSYIEVLNEIVIQSAKTINLDLDDMSEWMWWYNLNYRILWYRYKLPMLHAPLKENLELAQINWNEHFVNFYFDDNFQSWSINNKDKYHQFVKNGNWKLPAKEVIYDVTKDDEYKSNKAKVPSLGYLDLTPSTFAMNSKFETVNKEELLNYLNEENFYTAWIN